MQLAPFDDFRIWKATVEKKGTLDVPGSGFSKLGIAHESAGERERDDMCVTAVGSVGMQRLNTMVSTMVLRRTKEEMTERKQLDLTERKVETHMIQLRKEERDIYHVLFTEARSALLYLP